MKEFFRYNDKDILIHYSRDEQPNPQKFKMHTHEQYELFHFMGGKGTYKIEGNNYSLEKGDILIMREAESHYIDICPDFPYTRLSVHFSPSLFSSIDPSGRVFAPFTERDAGKFNQYKSTDFENDTYRIFIKNMISNSDNKRAQVLSNLIALLNEIYRAFAEKIENNQGDPLPYRIVSYVNRNLSENITLDSICREFYISKPQLCRIFKAATGSTVWDYITLKRLIMARTLIQTGSSPTKVFTQCGFSDYSAFYRAYHKKYGVSPREKI